VRVSDQLPGNGRPDVFDERERAFEAKYRLDEESAFRANARCATLFGRWVAGQLGLAGEAGEAYAKSVREVDLAGPNHKEMLAKALSDLRAKGIETSEGALLAAHERLHLDAQKQIENELATGRLGHLPGP